jgi:hypothetical protein
MTLDKDGHAPLVILEDTRLAISDLLSSILPILI